LKGARNQRPHRIEHAQAPAVQHRQALAIAQHLDLEHLLEFRRQFVGLQHRQKPNGLVCIVKLGTCPRLVDTQAEKIGQDCTRVHRLLLGPRRERYGPTLPPTYVGLPTLHGIRGK